MHLDEYKNNLDLERREFLKGLWDGAGRSRMNMDNDKKRETTAVDCGVVMSGQEMPTADIALFNRLVFLTFNKTVFSDQEKRNYEALKLIERRGLTHLTGQLIQLRNIFQGNFRLSWDEAVADLNDRVRKYNVEDRTLKNWATLLAAFKSVEGHSGLPFTYSELLDISASMCAEQNSMTMQNNELAGFWETIDILAASSKIWIKVDYKIKNGSKKPVRLLKGEAVELNPVRRYLYIRPARVLQLYIKEGKDSGVKTIPKDSLKYYLENCPEYYGVARSERFCNISNQQGYIPDNPEARQSTPTTAMIFDYDALQERYNINLDFEIGFRDEEEEESVPISSQAPSSIFSEVAEDE